MARRRGVKSRGVVLLGLACALVFSGCRQERSVTPAEECLEQSKAFARLLAESDGPMNNERALQARMLSVMADSSAESLNRPVPAIALLVRMRGEVHLVTISKGPVLPITIRRTPYQGATDGQTKTPGEAACNHLGSQ